MKNPKRLSVVLFCSLVLTGANAGDVFLSLTRSPFPQETLPTNTTVISSDEIKESGAQNVAEVLEEKSTVNVNKSATRGSLHQLSLRGFSSTRVLVLIDGRPVRNLFTGTIDLSQIPTDFIERIEVVRGPASALYGQNATGGVVNLITRRGRATIPRFSLDAQTGSFNTRTTRVQTAQKAGRADALISASRNLSDGFRTNSDFSNWSVDGTLGFDAPSYGRTEIQGTFLQSEVGTPGALALDPVAYDGELDKAASSPSDRQRDRDRAVRAEHALPIGDQARLIGRFFWDQKDEQFKNVFGGSPLFTTSHALDRKAELQAHLPAGFIIGGEFEAARFTDDFNPRYTSNIWSGYAQNTFCWGERVTTILGLRGDHDSNFGGTVNPRATVIVQAKPGLKFSGNGGRAFRAPTFADLFTPTANPNPDVKPETTWSGDLGAEVRPNETLRARTTLFHTFTQDRIVSDSGNGFRADNLAEAFTRGVETELEHSLVGALRHSAEYTFTEARGKRTGFSDFFNLPLVPRHKARYTLEMAPPEGFRARSSWRYLGVNYFPNFDGSARTVLPEVVLWDIRLGYRKHLWEVFFLLENLLNRRYALNANPPEFGGGFFPQPGRTYSGGLSVRFY